MNGKFTWKPALLAGLVLGAAPAAFAQGALPFADEAIPTIVSAPRPAPVLRSLGRPELWSAAAAVLVPALGPDDVVGAGGGFGPALAGRVHDLSLAPEGDGQWTELEDGGRLWTLAVRSPNAPELRLRFEPFEPPAGCELIVYSGPDAKEAHGPYRSGQGRRGLPFWAPTVLGSEARVELYVPPGSAMGPLAVRVTGVAQMFPMPEQAPTGQCRIDLVCQPQWATTARAVGRIRFVRDGSVFLCSGAMAARYQTNDWARIFLTAAHCVDTEAEASTVEVRWNHQNPVCGSGPPLTSTTSTGATLLATDHLADYAVIGLLDSIPADVVYAGWDFNEAPDPTPAHTIHHPGGDVKKISWGNLEGYALVFICDIPDFDDAYSYDLDDGGLEPGSSGSQVFDDANHRARAVTSCGPSGDCESGAEHFQGGLSWAYDNLWPFLAAQNEVWVDGTYIGKEVGTIGGPFKTVMKAWFGAHGGGTVRFLRGGTYPPITLPASEGEVRTITFTLEPGHGPVEIGR